LRESLVIVGVGIAIGVAVAALGTRLIARMLFGLPALDPLSFGTACFVLLVVASLAAYLPARRASRTDALTVLRTL
jgi:putative ABC transport system permease protein